MHTYPKVLKKTLSNGLVVLVYPVHHIPKVTLNLWYGVGSKHERSGQKGLAHLVEHMIFKGTTTGLSESDIDAVTTKLSGYTNAFTSYDYTAYVFEFPSQAWTQGLFLLSETMCNCRFDEQMLNSELSAVIQELKMYKDDYFDVLLSSLSATIFNDHPYHYPIIGFKQNLWELRRQALIDFYHEHYVPNNAALVIVGDVDPEQAFTQAEQAFDHIQKDPNYTKQEFYLGQNNVQHTVTLYRDVQQSQAVASYLLPGAHEKKRYLYELVTTILGKGKCSVLYAKIVDELKLASEIHASLDQRQDASLLDITFQPNSVEDIGKIFTIIQEEIDALVQQCVTEYQLMRAQKQVKTSLYSLLENPYDQAVMIGESYIVVGDENYMFDELSTELTDPAAQVVEVLKTYCHSTAMHRGIILPLPEDAYEYADALQELSDREDNRVLANRTRTTEVEAPQYAPTVVVPPCQKVLFPDAVTSTLANGLRVMTVERSIVPVIELVLALPVKEYADPQDKQGLYRFMCDVMLEGTKNYPGTLLAQAIEGYGMSLNCEPGVITLTVLKEDFTQGLRFLNELLTQATFEEDAVEKIRTHLLMDLQVYWDEPQEFSNQLARAGVYREHPYAKDPHGTSEGIEQVTQTDLQQWYKKVCVPQGASLAVVGDTAGYDVLREVQTILGSWQGVSSQQFPKCNIAPLAAHTVTYPINRDQVVLLFAGLSITRLHPDYEKLLLFDQIFGGGAQGSMSSRLFKVREQTGLFYAIGGTLIAGCAEQPGMVLVKTTVSLDRLKEAKEQLTGVMSSVVDSLTEEELTQAKRTILEGLVENVSSNKKVAGALLGLARFDLPVSYFDTLPNRINAYTLSEVQAAARALLDTTKLITLEIGRV